jgi:hypothetical protein
VYPLSAMPFPMNTFPMEGPHISSGLSYGGNQFLWFGLPSSWNPFTWGKPISSLEYSLSYFCLFVNICFSNDAHTNLYGSIRRRILPFQTRTGCKPGSFLVCNVSKPIFLGTLVSNATTHHCH